MEPTLGLPGVLLCALLSNHFSSRNLAVRQNEILVLACSCVCIDISVRAFTSSTGIAESTQRRSLRLDSGARLFHGTRSSRESFRSEAGRRGFSRQRACCVFAGQWPHLDRGGRSHSIELPGLRRCLHCFRESRSCVHLLHRFRQAWNLQLLGARGNAQRHFRSTIPGWWGDMGA